jgi:hypothetical protein
MAARNIAVFGIYTDQMSAGEGADALQRIGFRNTDTSILVPDNIGTKDFGHVRHNKALQGAAIGTLLGILAGCCAGWLVATGRLNDVAWLTQFAAQVSSWGMLGAILSGAGAGSVLGLLIGALAGAAATEYEAVRYEGRTRRGGVLLSVHCDNVDWSKRAKDILKQTGAKDIGLKGEAKADFGASEKPLPRTRTVMLVTKPDLQARELEVRDVEAREHLSDEPAPAPYIDSHL